MGELKKTTKIFKIICVPTDVRNGYLPNRSQNHYHLNQLRGKYLLYFFLEHNKTERGRFINSFFIML
jgi:hypothetical protein